MNKIKNAFLKDKGLKLMTHVVAGYPDMDTTEKLIETMVEKGADLVEIQIPFSDPLADGPTIMSAGQKALDNGTTPGDCFMLASRLSRRVDVPLLMMTYANIPFSMGFEKFMNHCGEAGVSGVIIPDLPYDEENGNYLEIAAQYGISVIPVVSPGMKKERLRRILAMADRFVYATLRVGITGARKVIDEKGLAFLETIRQITPLPIAAGFGISSAPMARQLEGRADCAVIGSYVINLFNNEGIEGVARFLDGF